MPCNKETNVSTRYRSGFVVLCVLRTRCQLGHGEKWRQRFLQQRTEAHNRME